MGTIKLDVGDEVAGAFQRLTEQEKQAFIETFVRLLADQRTLFQVMDDIGDYAKRQGMTDEILKELLNKR